MESHQTQKKLLQFNPFQFQKSKKDLQSFLGLCNYYRKFVKGFSHTAAPLNNLLKADQKFLWTDKCQHAFESLKQSLSDHPVLIFPNFNKEFLLYTDASDSAIGYVLGQYDEDKERVIAHSGRSMNTSERKWGITDKEGLALIERIKHFQVYLTGKHFTVYTDHTALKSLQHLSKQQLPRLMHWSNFLHI